MLLQVAFVFLILKASSIDYADLVADVENTFDECFGIVEDVGRYVYEVNVLQEVRRATDENDNHATDVKLGACVSMLKAVDTYRENHSRLVLYQEFLKLKERAYLNKLLKPLSKKTGGVLYVASMDGDDISDLRRACGKQTPTLIVLKSTDGTVFGAYTDASYWLSGANWQGSSTTFLFRLRPSFEQYGIVRAKQFGFLITDGKLYFGQDLLFYDHFMSNSRSTISGKSHTYDMNDFELNDGNLNFQVKEFIALKVLDM